MSTLPLDGLWLNAYANPADALQLRLQPGWQPRLTRPGQVRTYGTRRRAIAGEATWRDPVLPLRMVTVAQLEDLERRIGAEQWIRTSTGLRLVGIFWSLDPTMRLPEAVTGGLVQLNLTVEQVSGSDTLT